LFSKLVFNDALAYTTDTMHRVYLKPAANPQAFVSSFYNSLSLTYSEICGRSYGGGVLELMPNEAEKILLPYKEENAQLFKPLDDMLRGNTPIEEILNFTNKIILEDRYGFSPHESKLATSIWKKLSSRRMNRAKSK
jgi:adenine-specific DNA-methyltransferase